MITTTKNGSDIINHPEMRHGYTYRISIVNGIGNGIIAEKIAGIAGRLGKGIYRFDALQIHRITGAHIFVDDKQRLLFGVGFIYHQSKGAVAAGYRPESYIGSYFRHRVIRDCREGYFTFRETARVRKIQLAVVVIVQQLSDGIAPELKN